MDGIVLDDCWLFLIKKGRINAYSAYPDKKGDISMVQKGDGEILPFTPTTMKEFVAGHKRAMAFVEEGDLYGGVAALQRLAIRAVVDAEIVYQKYSGDSTIRLWPRRGSSSCSMFKRFKMDIPNS